MEFSFTEEQVLLRDSLRSYLGSHCGFVARMAASRSDTGWDEGLWRDPSVRLGVLGATLPESAGGLGGTAVDTMIVMEELGESLALSPYLETVVLAGSLLTAGGGREAELAAIIRGEAVYAFASGEPSGRYASRHVATRADKTDKGWKLSGTKSVVTAAPWATNLLVSARTAGAVDEISGISLFLVDPQAKGVTLTAYPTIDGRRAADISFENVKVGENALVGELGEALPAIERASDAAIGAIGAEAIGVMRRLLQDTIDYTGQRRQFGQTIGTFQALQHRMVDMFMQLEMATSAVYLATLSLDANPIERAKAASAAKVTVGNACRFIGQNAVQLHGGMGMTDELTIGHYFKRATVIESELGSTDYHLTRFAELSRAA